MARPDASREGGGAGRRTPETSPARVDHQRRPLRQGEGVGVPLAAAPPANAAIRGDTSKPSRAGDRSAQGRAARRGAGDRTGTGTDEANGDKNRFSQGGRLPSWQGVVGQPVKPPEQAPIHNFSADPSSSRPGAGRLTEGGSENRQSGSRRAQTEAPTWEALSDRARRHQASRTSCARTQCGKSSKARTPGARTTPEGRMGGRKPQRERRADVEHAANRVGAKYRLGGRPRPWKTEMLPARGAWPRATRGTIALRAVPEGQLAPAES